MNIAKRIISLIIFLALFAVSALRINTVLNYQDDVHSRAEFSQFYSLPSDILDAVWIGSSSVQEFAIAPVMYKENGIALYPMAFGNLPFNATRFLITEIEKTQDPEVYLVDISLPITAFGRSQSEELQIIWLGLIIKSKQYKQ